MVDETQQTFVTVYLYDMEFDENARRRRRMQESRLGLGAVLLGCMLGYAMDGIALLIDSSAAIWVGLGGYILAYQHGRRGWFHSAGRRVIADLIQCGRTPLEAYAVAERSRPAFRVLEGIVGVWLGAFGGVLWSSLPLPPAYAWVKIAFPLAVAACALYNASRELDAEVRVNVEDVAVLSLGKFPMDGLPALALPLYVAALAIAYYLSTISWVPALLAIFALMFASALFPRERRRRWARNPMTTEARLNQMILEFVEAR